MQGFSRVLVRGLLAAALLGGMSQIAVAEMVLNAGNSQEPESLDIHKSSGISEANIQNDLFEGLLTQDAKAQPIPGAAESWTVSDDGKTYTFKLRADGKWSDGTPVTAGDFVFAWKRLLDQKTASPYGYFIDQVVNAKDIRLGNKPADTLGVKAVDDRTFEVTLVGPTPYFLSTLTHHATFPLSRANIEKFGDDYIKPGSLVSNGAYKLAEAVPQSHVKLIKNPEFHASADVKIDTVNYFVTEDVDAELARFKAGELDYTYTLPNQQIPELKQTMADEVRIVPYIGTYYYTVNLTHEPWKSHPELRHALSLAIDRDVMVGKIIQGGELPAYAFVPPGMSNYAAWTPKEAGETQAQRDAEAKELFAKAGYGPDKPLQVEISYNTSENHKRIAVAIGAMWKQKLGVDTTLTNLEWGTMQSALRKKEYKDVARTSWIGDFDDPSNFLDLFRSTSGEQNYPGYASPDYDRLMDAAVAEADLAKRGQILAQAEQLFMAEQAIIPIYYYTSKRMLSTKVKGWQDNVLDNHLSRWLTVER
ncbi:peptide ABC transporter substrate-binding protein [Inquilinus sp. NPDC058860]|uniref:peptide ABC transporter substrate-binding protein n=1 Tax=Inquilinus sp. NPDC058860 TaxID=3346652 RepID=UPI00369E1AB6